MLLWLRMVGRTRSDRVSLLMPSQCGHPNKQDHSLQASSRPPFMYQLLNTSRCPVAGLINAAPGKKNNSLQIASRQVEAMVKSKMSQREYIILCLEDTCDWSNASTRRIVQQARAASSWLVTLRWHCPATCRVSSPLSPAFFVLRCLSYTCLDEPFSDKRNASLLPLRPTPPCRAP